MRTVDSLKKINTYRYDEQAPDPLRNPVPTDTMRSPGRGHKGPQGDLVQIDLRMMHIQLLRPRTLSNTHRRYTLITGLDFYIRAEHSISET